jgi:WhiB family redox-sensing transcriptional regulator
MTSRTDNIETQTDDRPWALDSACRGLDSSMFFPGHDGDSEPALLVCSGCAVRDECLDFALETRQRYGIWGGTTERQRRRMMRQTA